MENNDIKKLMSIALKADKSAPVAYSFGDEKFSLDQVNSALAAEFARLGGTNALYRENKNTIFRLIEETINEVLPKRVLDRYVDFADVRTVAQGEKAVYNLRISEFARKRAKTFVTRVGLAGRYETFILDGTSLEVGTSAYGGAARVGFEEMLDGRFQFSDFTEILLEGMDEFIYKEVAKALAGLVEGLPETQKTTFAGFDEKSMDNLLVVADSYGQAAIYCTQEFAATMVPTEGWISTDMKNERWNSGYLANYKGHRVIILPQSMEDETNAQKVIDPQYAYIIPSGTEKPIKIVFEGSAQVRDVVDNDDWSHDFQTYHKYGVATFANNFICVYQNNQLKKAVKAD